MSTKYQRWVEALVQACEGNQSEAARAWGVHPSYVSRILSGRCPKDVKKATWMRLSQALQAKSGKVVDVVRETAPPYGVTVPQSIAHWLENNPQHINLFAEMASSLGWER